MNRALGWMTIFFLLAGCKSLKEGECENDTDCKGEVEGLAACYKEPPDAKIGKCMTMKEARATHDRYKRKLSGKCEDHDGDGAKSGDACDPPLDCADDDPAIKPGASETCDGKDNNCDEVINEGLRQCVGTVLGGKQEPIVHFISTLPAGVEVAPSGEVYATDQHQIYRIDASNKIHRVAGSNKPGSDDKKGKFARFDVPVGMAVGTDGTVYVAECNNNCVRKVAPDGQVSLYAGKCSSAADDTGVDREGTGDQAGFWCPVDLAFDKDGSLLVVDRLNSKIKRIGADRSAKTVAGRGGKEDDEGYTVFGYSNGPALKAEFNEPSGIAVGKDGTIYITDMKNHCIRTFKDGKVGTLAGKCASGSDKGGFADGPASKAKFNQPNALDVGPDGTVYIADTKNHCIRKIKDGKVSTLSGRPGQQGYYDGPIKEALFNGPMGISIARDGSLYVIDQGNYRVRHIVP